MRRRIGTANLVGAVVAVASVPLLVLIAVVLPLLAPGGPTTDVVHVAAGKAVSRTGVRVLVRAAGEFDRAQKVSTPAGVALDAVAIRLTPDGGAPPDTCDVTLTAPGGGGERTWDPESDVSGYGYGRGDGFEEDCVGRITRRTEVEAVFLVPEGTLAHAEAVLTLTRGHRTTELHLALPKDVNR